MSDVECRVAKLEENLLLLRRELNEDKELERRRSDLLFESLEELKVAQVASTDAIAAKAVELIEYNFTLRVGRSVFGNWKWACLAVLIYIGDKFGIDFIRYFR